MRDEHLAHPSSLNVGPFSISIPSLILETTPIPISRHTTDYTVHSATLALLVDQILLVRWCVDPCYGCNGFRCFTISGCGPSGRARTFTHKSVVFLKAAIANFRESTCAGTSNDKMSFSIQIEPMPDVLGAENVATMPTVMFPFPESKDLVTVVTRMPSRIGDPMTLGGWYNLSGAGTRGVFGPQGSEFFRVVRDDGRGGGPNTSYTTCLLYTSRCV